MLVGAVYSVNTVSRMHYTLDAVSANAGYFASVQAGIDHAREQRTKRQAAAR
ncbi:hypothetical protein [Marinihelvus fidelis]|uniref:hypothetical protein n=1 Tax=Marinihelvus fidelis TaxID=2613842 RepID=UPI00177B8732|nr:hypothetical protein [Marinihelvus fidelis]